MRHAVIAILAACSNDPKPSAHPFSSDGTHLRDDQGRIVLLRGVNARVDGVFDVTFDDGRTALEPIPALDNSDCQRMRQLGLDFLRLPINWSAIEPTEGTYDQQYLARVDDAVQCAARAGVVVMIDLHQDAYSKEIGEDGAPLWAIDPAPAQLLQGPLTDLGDRRTSAQVNNAFDTFFGADATLRTKFYAVLDLVAAQWANDPAVIGFELFNEPPVGDTLVTPFSEEAAQHVHDHAPDKLVMFEPSATRNLFDFAPKSDHVFPVENAVYAPHVYTYVFSSTPVAFTADDLESSVANARLEATSWGTPLMIGEYGIGPTQPNADLWMQTQATLHDRYLASDAFWVWKEESQGAWGVFDNNGDTWTERPQVVAWLSRVHAARIAGDVTANESTPTTLHLETHGSSTPHSIYTPGEFTATCNGSTISATRDAATGLVELPCDGVLDVSSGAL
ncbi:MAG: cellulase family glycosylhydrolase [Kofleriaceae bacterium]